MGYLPMAPIGLGLIGLGRHGQRYARHLLEGIPNCQFVAVCRRDASQGHLFAKQHDLRFYHDHHELVADSRVEAVLLVIPPDDAVPVALDIIRHNKPLLIEKPLGCTSEEALQVHQASTTVHTPIMVAHTLRYEEAIIQLKAHGSAVGPWQYLVLTNRLELVFETESGHHPSREQGALLEIGIHQLDVIRFLTDQDVSHVYCEMERRTSQGPDIRAWAHVQTESGLPCLLDNSRMSQARVTRAEIIGQTGQLIADWTAQSLSLHTEGGTSTSIPFTPQPTIPRVISDFVHAIQTGTSVPITSLDGLRAVEVADACYESANTRNTVYIERKGHFQ